MSSRIPPDINLEDYINYFNSSKDIINSVINILQLERYNDTYNNVLNNILILINNQNIQFSQYINYNYDQNRRQEILVMQQIEQERQNSRRYDLERIRVSNNNHYYDNYTNRVSRNTPDIRQPGYREINRPLQPGNINGRVFNSAYNTTYDDIVHILFTTTDNDVERENTPELLSPAQINLATRIMFYQELSDEIKNNQTRCPISYQDFENDTEIILIKQCNHIFKKQSLLNWFLTSSRCPMCRYNLTSFNNNSDDNSDYDYDTE
jgi:hypothetical protein